MFVDLQGTIDANGLPVALRQTVIAYGMSWTVGRIAGNGSDIRVHLYADALQMSAPRAAINYRAESRAPLTAEAR